MNTMVTEDNFKICDHFKNIVIRKFSNKKVYIDATENQCYVLKKVWKVQNKSQ